MGGINKPMMVKDKVNLLVFDVDGVLVDTSTSYTEAIRRAVYNYGNMYGMERWEMPTVKDVTSFRMLPGFNNDWDLAEALLAYKILEHLCVYDSLDNFLKDVKENGIGLYSVYKIIENLDPGLKNKLKELFNNNLIRKLTMEYYGGINYCKRLYGFENQYVFEKGMLENEYLLVDREMLKRLKLKKAIVTGRNIKELEIFLERNGLEDVFDFIFYHGREGIVKPDGRILEIIKNKLNASGIVYFGDSYDDYLVVKNYKEISGDDNVIFIQIINNSADAFDSDVIATRDMNEVLKVFERK
ncbi:MAG: HAD-IA family hydrolase [Candidatus Marinimicrobia bacterium]|nr:HAD-IA family hydrolase [Candidatus Neomarinimicrobiota bacterium]